MNLQILLIFTLEKRVFSVFSPSPWGGIKRSADSVSRKNVCKMAPRADSVAICGNCGPWGLPGQILSLFTVTALPGVDLSLFTVTALPGADLAAIYGNCAPWSRSVAIYGKDPDPGFSLSGRGFSP